MATKHGGYAKCRGCGHFGKRHDAGACDVRGCGCGSFVGAGGVVERSAAVEPEPKQKKAKGPAKTEPTIERYTRVRVQVPGIERAVLGLAQSVKWSYKSGWSIEVTVDGGGTWIGNEQYVTQEGAAA